MDNGFIFLDRKILKWEWYDDPNTFRVFLHLLLNANHAKGYWKGHPVNRGQFITGREELAKKLKITEQQVRTSSLSSEYKNRNFSPKIHRRANQVFIWRF